MSKYKIFRDETYVYYVEANSWEEAQEIADDAPEGVGELLSVHHEVMEVEEWYGDEVLERKDDDEIRQV